MRPPGSSVMFADQIHSPAQIPYNQRPNGGRRVQIVDSFYPHPPPHHPPPPNHQRQQNGNHQMDSTFEQNGHQMGMGPPSLASPPPAPQRCQCCPFGFHIDLGFVKFAEDVAAGKEQIQNWSSPAKKHARRLLVSPSSDRTLLDISGCSEMANISGTFPNDSSLMSKSLEMDDNLPELVDHHRTISSPYTNGNRPRAPSVPVTPQQYYHQPQGILKNADWQNGNGNYGTSRTAPIPIHRNGGGRENYQLQQRTNPIYSPHFVPQQQHQSRFYDAHVQQQQQQHRRRHPLSVPSEQPFPLAIGSPPTFVGSPLRTSTPRSNDEIRQIMSQRPLHISTANHHQHAHPPLNGDGSANSAPSSPIPKANAPNANYQSSIAQSMAQLRKTPQKGMATATFSTKPQAHTSLSALSSMARNAFANPPITTRRYYLESGGARRVLSPEPHLPSMGDGAVRSSNLQSRTFFHQNHQNGHGIVNRMPYRSRGAGSAPHIGPSPFGSSTLELGEFASIRRRRLDADIGGSATLHSAHLVRSISPPIHFPPSGYSSTNSPSSGGSLPRGIGSGQEKHSSSSMANLLPELSEFYDEGTLKADKSKKRKTSAPAQKEYQIPVQNVQASLLKHSGTQTAPKPIAKEIGILTEQQQIERKKPPTPPAMTPKKEMREIGISTPAEYPFGQQAIFGTSPAPELPFFGLIQVASIGVDTVDLGEEQPKREEKGRKIPPRPPPKPSGPDLEAELRKRRQQELMGTLVAEFQYCLGHEPEHHPDQQPPLLEKGRKFAENGQQVRLAPETVDRGVDAFGGIIWGQSSMGTSTTDLAAKSKIDASVGTLPTAKMTEIGVETEPKAIWAIGIQTEERAKGEGEFGVERTNAETQTENGWMEAEIGRRLTEAEAERREKRKRNSVERSTETDEEEAPDQFIMITCNKCEQRSSVASDELFEKILVPEEPMGEEMRQIESQQESTEILMGESGIPATLLKTVKEEPEFLSSHEEIKIPEILDLKKGPEEEMRIYAEIELRRSEEFKSMEMWRLVNIEEQEMDGNVPAEMPKANEVPKLVIEEIGGNREEIQPIDESTKKGPSPTLLSSQIDQILQGKNGEKGKSKEGSQKEQSASPLSSDEGLVLGEEDLFEGSPELLGEFDLEADRISVETDVQTVICVEPSANGARSSSSASSKTPTTPTASHNGESVSARTEALRKLLTEPPRRQPFQRDVDSNRSYRSDKSKTQQLDLEYIADRHKSTEAQQSEPSTPCSSAQTKKALKETISLKKNAPSTVYAAPGASSSNAVFPPDPIPARIPRPKIARYSPNVSIAETPDEEAEAADRLTPLRSEMRSLSAWVSPTSSPRMPQRALIFRTQIGGPLEEEEEMEDEEDLEVEGATSSSSSKEQLPQDPPEEEDASSTSSDGARTYEMSDDENVEFFELSAPLRDALETINDFLLEGSKTPTANKAEEAEEGQGRQQGNQIEWAQKYAQHEWLKMATRKNANAELVDQFIDALESFSTQLMDTVINMTDQNGNTALHYAVSNENFDVVSVLLDSKVCRVDQMNKAGYSALMLGALCELRNETECAIMQRLFQMGNVNAKAVKHSQTALMLAASHGRVESTNLLLKCGADVNIQDIDGSTALMCAAEHGQKEIVKILLKQPNIDASLTDCDSQTALSIAVENQHRDIGVLIYAHLNFSRLAETSGENSVSI